jgi:hypothetical protein
MAGRLKRIKFHYEGFNALRKSPEVVAALEAKGEAIAQAAGGSPDFEVIVAEGKSRARVIVTTASIEGMVAEATDRALTQALSAGRG